MVTFTSHSPAETESLGESWGRAAAKGMVIGLIGDLGAGKTQLVKGIGRGLGVTERVCSPTFALVNIYSAGRLPLFHLDFYRLYTVAQIVAAGLEDYMYRPNGITVVEWIDHWLGPAPDARALPFPARIAQIEVINETQRRITHEDFGI